MTLESLANWFNIAGSAMVLALSLAVMRQHHRPYFARWVVAYTAGLVFLAVEMANDAAGRPHGLSALEAVVGTAVALAFVDFGLHVRGKALPTAWYVVGMVAGSAAYGVLTDLGRPFLETFLPTVVAIALSQIYCGGVLLLYGRRAAWQAWPQLAVGAWIFTYPALQGTPYFWVGFLVSALLHVLVGTTMLLYLLEDVTAELRQAAAHKEAFLSIVSHELRTPLSAIIGFRELLEDEAGDRLQPHQRGYLAQMQVNADQLSKLIDSMLDSFQLETGTLRIQREPVEVAAVLDEALGALRCLLAGKQLALEVDVPEGLPTVEGDRQRIVQVINNLVGNAAKFTPEHGRLQVTARAEGAQVRVEVRDTGEGILPEHLPHVFKPFYQCDTSLTRSHGGSGLGLSIVRELVERMGGSVGVESKPGQGSRFWFKLPVREDAARPTRHEPQPSGGR
jgi:signal transduction histidine kinase